MKNILKKLLRERLGDTAGYMAWLNQNKKRVKISNFSDLYIKIDPSMAFNDIPKYKEDTTYNKELKNFLATKIHPNECFINAANTFQFLQQYPEMNVSFVLGMMVENGKRFGHAWNIINDNHYDLTAEKFVKTNNQYYQIVVLNNMSDISQLAVFDENTKCAEGLSIDGDDYDVNGMCSLYPYYLSV